MEKIKIKEFIADQMFRYDLGIRMFNYFRMVLMIITLLNTFILMFGIHDKKSILIFYIVSVLFGTVGLWVIGYVLDKKNFQRYLDKAYFKRGNNIQKLDEVYEKLSKQIAGLQDKKDTV